MVKRGCGIVNRRATLCHAARNYCIKTYSVESFGNLLTRGNRHAYDSHMGNATEGSQMYYNALTKAVYAMGNQRLLTEAAILTGREEFEVAGFHQWLELGRCVAKGEHGAKIMMVCEKNEGEPVNGEQEKRRVMKMRTVFFRSLTVELAAQNVAA
jgi:hypothetical protein